MNKDDGAHASDYFDEDRMDAIGQNGGDGEHYCADESDKPQSKYHVSINGVKADVYDVLKAFGVTNPALQHAIKKMLKPGQRHAKSFRQDIEEAIVSLRRALELGE